MQRTFGYQVKVAFANGCVGVVGGVIHSGISGCAFHSPHQSALPTKGQTAVTSRTSGFFSVVTKGFGA
jgi:hypothetical protein